MASASGYEDIYYCGSYESFLNERYDPSINLRSIWVPADGRLCLIHDVDMINTTDQQHSGYRY